MTCIGKDPRCPCQDGDACHYKDCGNTKAWPVPHQWVGLTEQDMPSGEDPMFDHKYFIAGMVYAAKVLQKKNNAAPAAQPEQRKPLDEWAIDRLANNIRTADPVTWWRQLARDVENAHGIKENT